MPNRQLYSEIRYIDHSPKHFESLDCRFPSHDDYKSKRIPAPNTIHDTVTIIEDYTIKTPKHTGYWDRTRGSYIDSNSRIQTDPRALSIDVFIISIYKNFIINDIHNSAIQFNYAHKEQWFLFKRGFDDLELFIDHRYNHPELYTSLGRIQVTAPKRHYIFPLIQISSKYGSIHQLKNRINDPDFNIKTYMNILCDVNAIVKIEDNQTFIVNSFHDIEQVAIYLNAETIESFNNKKYNDYGYTNDDVYYQPYIPKW